MSMFSSKNHFKLAMANLKYHRGRSILTMVGIMIGVASVILIIAIGEGIKQQVRSDNSTLGDNLVTIQPAANGNFLQANRVALTTNDAAVAAKVAGVEYVVPLAAVSGVVTSRSTPAGEATIIAAGDGASRLYSSLVEYGDFSGTSNQSQVAAVVGSSVATRIFDEQVPLGQSFTIRGQRFVVQGVFKDMPSTPLTPGENLNNSIVIPFSSAQTITDGNVPVYQIIAKVNANADEAEVTSRIREAVVANRGGQQDVAILAPGESAAANAGVLSVVTYAIAAIAAISLIVAGIGVMNVMLVSVTERTHEIGIRKAIGATNRQILTQFITEATVLSVLGGLLGITFAFAVDGLARLITDFRPIISWQVAVGAFLATLLLGLIFGTAPAVKAARKDPIDALRN